MNLRKIPAPVVDCLPRDAAHTTIHKAPCKHCPSAHYPPDPESLDVQTWPRQHQREALFVCGWRPDKLCKGQCDELGFTEAELQATHDSSDGGSTPNGSVTE
jgi:hypothetical protein